MRLTRERQKALVYATVDVLRDGRPTFFRYEASARVGIRVGLILNRWSWTAADEMAAQIVSRALNMLGAVRPTWEMGQPWYVEGGALRFDWLNCIHCGRPFQDEDLTRPGFQRRYCSDECQNVASLRRRRLDKRDEINAKHLAYMHAVAARGPEYTCERCGSKFRPKQIDRRKQPRFCSRDCANKKSPPMAFVCIGCGTTFTKVPENGRTPQYCSRPCAHEHMSEHLKRLGPDHPARATAGHRGSLRHPGTPS